ncbi:Putative hydroxypyruvate isomerase YgbM [bacterium HR40]|nr:Putative hydroxypyruvate isomerase YgbM [bacterium HR40]
MPKFAANLSMMFHEVGFLERFGRAAACGFRGVEFLFPYAFDAAAIRVKLEDSGLEQVLFNLPPGNWDAGERGIAALPGREEEFARTVEQALEYAEELDCRLLHVMAGVVPSDADRASCEEVYVRNLALAADRAAASGRTVLIEPINTRDIPGYFLNYQRDARRIIERVGADNLRLQLDLYHCQIMEGDLSMHIREYLPFIGHIQIAGVPGRHEPDIGEINYAWLFDLLDELGYTGWVGCEYRPAHETEAGLGWFARWRSADNG